MSRYYLHLRNEGEYIRDPEGADFANVEAAKLEAVRSAREIIADEIYSGSPVDLRDSIEVADTEGRTVLTVPFSDAVSIRA
jgi:hypothetical protein